MKIFLTNVLDYIEKAEKIFIAVGLVLITFIVFFQVILRYIFHTGITGGEEFSRFIFVFITWIGASLGVKEREHIQITLLTDLIPKIKAYVDVAITFICIGICIFLLVSGMDMVELVSRKMQLSPALKFPMGIAYSIIPISAALMGVKYIRQLISEIKIVMQRV